MLGEKKNEHSNSANTWKFCDQVRLNHEKPLSLSSLNIQSPKLLSEFCLIHVLKMNSWTPPNFKNSARETFWLKKNEFWEILRNDWNIVACAYFGEKRRREAEKSQRRRKIWRCLLKIWCAYRRGSRGKKMPQKCQRIAQSGCWCAKNHPLFPSLEWRSSFLMAKKGRCLS